MKTRIPILALLVFAAFVSSLRFQCGSTEMTSARLYIQRAEWDNAMKNLEAELAKNPKNEEAWYLLGRVKAEKNDFASMNDAFDHTLQVGQTYAKEIHDVRFGYWGKYLNLGVESFNKVRDTTQYFDNKIDSLSALKREGTQEEINSLKKLKSQIVEESQNKSISAFQTAIVIIPDSAAAYRNLAFSYLSKNQMSEALSNLGKAFSLSKDLVSARYIGEINHDLGVSHKEKFESPANKTEIKIFMTPEEVKALLGEPTTKSTSKEKKTTIENWVYAPRKLTLNFVDGQLKSWEENGKKEEREPKVYYKDYAERDSAMKYFDRSIAALESARKIDPHNAEVIALLSNVYIAADKAETALEAFKSGVEADPKNKYFHYNYGVLLLKDNEFEKALEQFRVALALDSTYEVALYNLGIGYVNWGVYIRETAPDPLKVDANVIKEKFKLALPYLQQMTRLKPNDPDSWELLGKVYANLGMSKEATATFEKSDQLRKQK